ncbi:hypothetical protein LCGC14_0372810 [marine sediment metagenome]|uniref:Uncharacterized protein n=1 Tax=marine sediment metagenome TaxID=412755 RepID=A0A0F9T504_9ZZZZ
MAASPKGSINVWPELATGVVPVVAVDPTITVPALEAWDLESLEAELDTDANAANRLIQVIITDSSGVEISRGPIDGTAIIADKVVNYHLAQFGTIPADTATDHYDQIATAPKIRVPPGGIIKFVTAALQAGDQFTALKVMATKYSLPED